MAAIVKTHVDTRSGTIQYPNEDLDKIIAGTYDKRTFINNEVTSLPSWFHSALKSVNTVTANNLSSIASSTFYSMQSLTSATFNNCTVVGSNAFCYDSNLTFISLPNCELINASAFSSCTKLTSINFPNLKTIGSAAFTSCWKLQSFNLSKLQSTAYYAFNNCSALSYVEGSVCKHISTGTFQNCKSLTSISFPQCERIGGFAFRYCSSINFSSTLFGCLKYVEPTAFNNTNISTVYSQWVDSSFASVKSSAVFCAISDNELIATHKPSGVIISSFEDSLITLVGSSAFIGCSYLASVSLTSCRLVNTAAFSTCIDLSSINLPYCSQVGTYAFYYCQRLNTVSLPMCQSVNQYAFAGCSSLSTINLPMCTYVSGYAFSNCSSLTTVVFKTFSFPTFSSTAFNACTSLTSIYVQSTKLDYFKSNTGLSYYSNKLVAINNDSEFIYPYEYFSSTLLTIPASKSAVSAIGYNAFYNCQSLSYVSMQNCKIVGDYAFGNCSALKIFSGRSCEYVYDYAFYRCSNLSFVDLRNCKYIGSGAFYGTNINYQSEYFNSNYFNVVSKLLFKNVGNSNISLISFPSTVSNVTNFSISNCTAIGCNAIVDNSYLLSVNLPNCTRIESYAFESLSNVSIINLPACTSISSYAFHNLPNLTTLSLQNYAGPINSSIISLCSQLTSLYIPNVESSIYLRGFSNLTTLDITNCKSIGYYAFSSCSSLSVIKAPKCSYVDNYAFSGCNLREVWLDSCQSLNAQAFYVGNVSSLYLLSSKMCKLASSTYNVGFRASSIYVPADLLAKYVNDPQWSSYSSKFVKYIPSATSCHNLSIVPNKFNLSWYASFVNVWAKEDDTLQSGDRRQVMYTSNISVAPNVGTSSISTTISYSKYDKVATATITQEPRNGVHEVIDLTNSDIIDDSGLTPTPTYGFTKSTVVSPGSSYDGPYINISNVQRYSYTGVEYKIRTNVAKVYFYYNGDDPLQIWFNSYNSNDPIGCSQLDAPTWCYRKSESWYALVSSWSCGDPSTFNDTNWKKYTITPSTIGVHWIYVSLCNYNGSANDQAYFIVKQTAY